MGTMIALALLVVVAVVAILRSRANARRQALEASLRSDAPELPAPVAMAWVPTARRRRSTAPDHDPYGALSPGALEDRVRKH